MTSASAGVIVVSGNARAMESPGFQCEECEEAVWLPTSRSELTWLRTRAHVVREVAKHVTTGLDAWMSDGLAFLDRHAGHGVIVVTRRR